MAVRFTSALAEAQCRLVSFSNKKETCDQYKRRTQQAIRTQKRIAKRAARRANGDVVSPQPITFLPTSDVRLCGYRALRNVFPLAPRWQLVDALVAVQSRPVLERGAAAARFLIDEFAREQAWHSNVATRAPASLRIPVLQRSLTSVPCLSSAMSSADEAHDREPVPQIVLRRSRSVPVGAKLGEAGDVTDVPNEGRLTPRLTQAQGARTIADVSWRSQTCKVWEDDTLPLCSQRARKTDRKLNGERRRRYRNHVNRNLLMAPLPSVDVLQALPQAQAAAIVEAKAAAEDQEMIDSRSTELLKKHPLRSWTCLQEHFKKEFGQRILDEVGQEATLVPVVPSICKEFLQSCRGTGSRLPLPAYHGTSSKNIPSISQRGLFVPGNGGVQVAHGSAHGVGIYTARLGAAGLSRGFCDSSDMFVCGVADKVDEPAEQECEVPVIKLPPSRTFGIALAHRQHHIPLARLQAQQRQATQQPPVSKNRMFGRFRVHKDSSTVRHVGNAIVVFDRRLVAPMFLLRSTCDRSTIINPNRDGRRQTVVPELGETFWDPPVPEEWSHAKEVKRRFERRKWQVQRRAERDEKFHGR